MPPAAPGVIWPGAGATDAVSGLENIASDLIDPACRQLVAEFQFEHGFENWLVMDQRTVRLRHRLLDNLKRRISSFDADGLHEHSLRQSPVSSDRHPRLPFQRWRVGTRTGNGAHENPRTTKLYDRTKERFAQDEVESIRL